DLGHAGGGQSGRAVEVPPGAVSDPPDPQPRAGAAWAYETLALPKVVFSLSLPLRLCVRALFPPPGDSMPALRAPGDSGSCTMQAFGFSCVRFRTRRRLPSRKRFFGSILYARFSMQTVRKWLVRWPALVLAVVALLVRVPAPAAEKAAKT